MSPTELAAVLSHARRRTEALLEPVDDEQLVRQISTLQSPLVWDLAHIGYFEELWLLRRVGGRSAVSPEVDELYDSFAHSRSERGRLPILSPDAARRYLREVREAMLKLLPELSFDTGDPLLRGGFVVGMVAQHELQHVETMTQTLALGGVLRPPQVPEVDASGDVLVPSGKYTAGTADPWAYDNERPQHTVDLPAFRIDRSLVTNAEYEAFLDAGGYRRRDLWSDEGWAWREREGADRPLGWEAAPEKSREPVQHVSLYEAEAYARWTGKRLPTEAEWEKAVKTVGDELEHAR